MMGRMDNFKTVYDFASGSKDKKRRSHHCVNPPTVFKILEFVEPVRVADNQCESFLLTPTFSHPLLGVIFKPRKDMQADCGR